MLPAADGTADTLTQRVAPKPEGRQMPLGLQSLLLIPAAQLPGSPSQHLVLGPHRARRDLGLPEHAVARAASPEVTAPPGRLLGGPFGEPEAAGHASLAGLSL